VARFADRIAYVNHDLDDAVRAGIIAPADLPPAAAAMLGTEYARRVDTLLLDLVATSEDATEIALSAPVLEALDRLRGFLFERVYLRTEAQEEHQKAIGVVRSLFAYYRDHPQDVPPEYLAAPGDPATRVADYIAGMTDRFALRTYKRIFLPQGWLL
jgi:dGTPase